MNSIQSLLGQFLGANSDRTASQQTPAALVLDLLRQPITVADVVRAVDGLEHKAEIYVVSCLAIDEDDPRERAYLDQLASGLDLPEALTNQIRLQAQQGVLSN